MKLLLVLHNVQKRGGMEVQLAHLANGLAARGHLVRVASMRSQPPTPAERRRLRLDPRVQVIHLGARGRKAGLISLRRLASLARWSDLVHCTGWDASLWGRLAAVLARRPVVIAEHTPGREHQVSSSGAPRKTLIEWHNRLLDPFTAMTVICAERQRDLLLGEGVASDKMVCIPNGVPVEELRGRAREGATRATLGIPESARVVVHVARFEPQKRQVLSLETVARLRESLGDVRLVFAGEGTELDRVQEAARRMGADWATFLGRHDNVPSVFALADIAVLPSTGEALPMAILEAIAVGVPVVASDVGDVGETLRRTGAGVSVPADDPDAFHRACRDVLSDRELHDRLVAAADANRDSIDAATMVRQYHELLPPLRAKGTHGESPIAVAALAASAGPSEGVGRRGRFARAAASSASAPRRRLGRFRRSVTKDRRA